MLKDSQDPEFDISFKKGNHYTILIRKPGYLSKRMEAFVDVEGCILCFEGVGQVQPGVADNLTDENAAGVLLANVELEPIFTGKTLEIENIYYGLGKWNITKKAKEQLKKVILLMEDNPNLTLELGSHTDSRGKAAFNKNLSEKRAKASVDYVVMNSNVERRRVISKGYGEENILNKCIDGVKCDEIQHGENRRTELKIVGIGDIGRYKPLAQMKEEEYIEKEILGQGEVRVKEGETLEQVLERKAAQSAEEVEQTSQEEIVDPIEIEKEPVEKEPVEKDIISIVEETEVIEEIVKEDQIQTPVELPDAQIKEEVKAIEVAETVEAKDEIIASEEVPELPERTEETKLIEEVEKIDESILEVEKSKLEAAETVVEETVEEVSDSSESVNEEMDRLNEMPTANVEEDSKQKTGFKIVIHKSPKMLSAEDELIKRHDKLELYVADDSSIWYMMAGFTSKQQAQEALRFVKTTYPEAYIVNIVDGKLR